MKKRLLFIPLHYNATPRPHEDWFNALCEEFDCDYYEYGEEIYGYDYILIHSGAIPPDELEVITSDQKLIQWTGDCRPDVLPEVMAYKGIVDLTLLVAGIGQKEMYEKALGSPVGYLQQGIFESFFIKHQELQSGNVVFIGNNYDQFEGAVERASLCLLLSKTFCHFEVIGNGFDGYSHANETRLKRYNNHRSVPYSDSAKIYNESYISISHACFNDIEGYYSNRTIDIMASGGCCLMRRTPNIEQFFTDMYDCILYSSNDEAIEKIQHLIARPELRNMIAQNGHNTAKLKHTFRTRVQEMKQQIELCGI